MQGALHGMAPGEGRQQGTLMKKVGNPSLESLVKLSRNAPMPKGGALEPVGRLRLDSLDGSREEIPDNFSIPDLFASSWDLRARDSAAAARSTATPRRLAFEPAPDGFNPLALRPGDEFTASYGARYRVVRVLGQGNMGIVFHAQRLALNPCEVALKFVLDGANIDSLVQEHDCARRLNGHRFVAEINLLDAVEQIPFGEFQFIKGIDLERLVVMHSHGDVEYSVPQLLVAWAGWQAADALAAAHEIDIGKARPGILHRDIKPGNLMLDQNGTVKILDFGLAQDVVLAREKIRAGYVSGTPIMIPSELLMTPRDFAHKLARHHGAVEGDVEQLIDGRSDVFSLACTMYYLLTRVFPSEPAGDCGSAQNLLASINELHHAPLNPPHALVASVSPVLSKIIYLGAHPDPRIRPNAREFHGLLGAFIYPDTIGQGLFASHVKRYVDMLAGGIEDPVEMLALKSVFERPGLIIHGNPKHYPLHDELEARFEAAHERDRARASEPTRSGFWRSLPRLPSIRKAQEALVQDVGLPLTYTPECLELKAAGRNPARVFSASV